jgi:hypothetical protein
MLRDVVRGSFTPNTIQKHLVLLSICQTCKYMGVDFLDFLRSGEKDIRSFAESQRGRRRSNCYVTKFAAAESVGPDRC